MVVQVGCSIEAASDHTVMVRDDFAVQVANSGSTIIVRYDRVVVVYVDVLSVTEPQIIS